MNYSKLLENYNLSEHGKKQVLSKMEYFAEPTTLAEFESILGEILEWIDPNNTIKIGA